ncbi:FAD-dependent oxidoreductase [Streptomyces sp. NPDC001137]|uniref:NAD(P)/FAD-dependent oxidoreductase n=1 Tax=Streptomyces sp. NPDC001137 TaxID=3154378 RepID=UPI003319A4C9
MVHAFLSPAEARHHLAVQREMADGRYPLPDDVTTGDEARLLDDALSSGVRAAYLVEGEGVVDPEAFALGLGQALAAAGVKVHENAEAVGFRTGRGIQGSQVAAVRTTLGEMPCKAVVIAGGMRSAGLLGALGHPLPLQAGKGYSFSVDLDPAPRHTLYFGERRAVASPIGGTTRIGGTMELSGNNNRLDWRRVVAVALASRHYLGRWFDDPDDLVGLIRDPWVGGRPFLPDGLPVIDRVPGHANAFVATGHGMLGVTLGPVTVAPTHRVRLHRPASRSPGTVPLRQAAPLMPA